jgi:homoserine dehydrogenase
MRTAKKNYSLHKKLKMERKKLTIGLFGFGCVGAGLYEVLQQTPRLNAGIRTICVKDKNKKRHAAADRIFFDKSVILDDPEINVVVELIDDADAAFEIVSEALAKGKAVVSANKKMIATHFEELLVLQRRHKVPLLYEAACCASIPVIRNLEEYYDNDLLESLEGIVNGSTNFILSTTEQERCSYDEALKRAQALGYAESDPSLDTKGFDAKFKLVLLLAHAFGVVVKPENVKNIGIDRIGSTELAYASEKGMKIKLVAYAARNEGGRTEAFVMPKFVDSADKLYGVNDVFNGVKIRSGFSDLQFFAGKGAGAYPTASAVLSDITALGYGYRYEYRKIAGETQLEEDDLVILKVMICTARENSGKVRAAFLQVDEFFSRQQETYFIGAISLQLLHVLLAQVPSCSAVLFEVCSSRQKSLIAANAEPEFIG